MKGFLLYICIFVFTGLIVFASCDREEFSTNPQHILSFSADTLRLDTLLSDIGSSTYIVKVYNRNKKSLLISSVILSNASQSGFRINLDGMKGVSFTNVEIPEKDSLYIFVEATLASRKQNVPFLVKDSIVFLTNGVQQDIKLWAYGQDVDIFRGKVIDNDTTITGARPVLIYDSLHVARGATLTLAAGSRLYFHYSSGLKVYGRLYAEGTLSAPVTLRGDRTDKLFPDLPYDRLPGQWEGVRFYESSYSNRLSYTDIHGGKYGIKCDASGIDKEKIVIMSSVITQVSADALSLTDCKAVVANTEISNAGGSCVQLLGGEYEFIHCTLANYFNWEMRQGTTLSLSNEQDGVSCPLSMASFRNCIVAGSFANELSRRQSANETVPFNDEFSHCLINSKEETGSSFIDVVWAKDDHFQLLDKASQRYDFRLDVSSAAIDLGAIEDAAGYPTDRNGISRINDKAPDAGCYEWIEQ